jgi:two-component system chemotaxis response regulator CheB
VKRRPGRNIIVVGTSAGGLETLDHLVGQLPTDLASSIFIVQHMAAPNSGEPLLRRLGLHQAFRPKLAEHGGRFRPGCIYIAPPDNHLLLKKDRMLVTKGARENRFRPGIDPLFRSAAVAHGARVIRRGAHGHARRWHGRTDGDQAVRWRDCRTGSQGCGVFGDAAQRARQCRRRLLRPGRRDGAAARQTGFAAAWKEQARPVRYPDRGADRRTCVERCLSGHALGDQVPYNCPNCGGVLWQIDTPGEKRFRCHTGHSYTGSALLESQSEKIEELLWISLRMFEERRNLLTSMAKAAGHRSVKRSHLQRLGEAQGYIDRIRGMLLAPHSQSAEDTLTRVKGEMAEPRKARSTR